MKPCLYILILFLFPFTVAGQMFYEQIAFDHFKKEISSAEYGYEIIFKVEPKLAEYSPIYRPKCYREEIFQKDWIKLSALDSAGIKIIESLNRNYVPVSQYLNNNRVPKDNFKTKLTFLESLRSKRIRNIKVSEPVILMKDAFIVTVFVYVPYGLDCYFIEITKEGKVNRWCKGGMVY